MKVSFRARWGLVLAILAGACNRSLTPSSGPTAGNGGLNPSGGGGVAIAGAAGQVGTGAGAAGGGGPAGSAGAGGAGASGVGGAIGGDADGGSAGGGGFMPTGVLAPLAISDATLDQATGAQLFDLARNVAYAQGWAECTCLIPNSQTLSPDTLDTCARAEAGYVRALFDPNESRCILDQSRSVPGFDDYLRCRTKALREIGREYAECAMGINTRPGPGLNTCIASPTAQNLLAGVGCERAFYCADGTVAMTGRCDYIVDCADGADEHGCGEFVCGDALIDPGSACDPTVCAAAFVPPLCAPGDPTRLLCGDGTDTSVLAACNGVFDCVNGRDEAYCF